MDIDKKHIDTENIDDHLDYIIDNYYLLNLKYYLKSFQSCFLHKNLPYFNIDTDTHENGIFAGFSFEINLRSKIKFISHTKKINNKRFFIAKQHNKYEPNAYIYYCSDYKKALKLLLCLKNKGVI